MNEWFLETTEDADVSICIVLKDIREYTIGRKKGYDIVSPNPLVSRNHGVITITPDRQLYIKDLKSANGTYVNDKAIPPLKDYLLKKDDLLGIGAPSTAIEPKKEIFWVRCNSISSTRLAEVVHVTEADSISINELNNKDVDKNLDKAVAVPSKIAKVSNINQDVVASDDEIFPKNVKTAKDNSDNRISPGKDLCKQSCSANKEKKNITATHISEKNKKTIDDFPNSSTNSTVNNDSKNISNIKKSFNELEKSLSKTVNSDCKNKNESVNSENKNTSSSKVVEKSKNSDPINNSVFLSNPDQNKTSTPSDATLNSLNEKGKASFRKIIICSSSDEEENVKNDKSLDKKSSNSEKKTYDNYESDDDILMERVNLKSEPNNHSFTQNDDDVIVIVSDDDDEIFPKSQIFGDIDAKVKDEPIENENITSAGTSPVSDSIENNHDNIYREIVKNEIPDYDYNDNDNDEDASDDDCILWYHKLSQSQDFISSSQKRKLEPPDVVELDDFPKFDVIDDIDFEKPQDEDSRESRISPVASDTNKDDEQLKSKDVEPNLDDTTDSRPTDKISSTSSSSKLLSTDEKEEEKSEKKKLDSKKSYIKPPVIDAPFLRKGKRKAHEETKSKETSSSSSKPKRRKSTYKDIPSVSASVKTIVQSSILNIDKSVKNELDKRHKNKRRRKSTSTETFTKNEKQKIQEDRKKKLKELASKITESKEKKEEVQKSHHTKPKVKISTGRGVFLTSVDPKQTSEKKMKSDAPLEEESKKKFKIPKRSNSVSSEPSTSKASTSCQSNICKISKPNIVNKNKETVEPLISETIKPIVKRTNKLSFNNLEQEPVEKLRRLSTSSNNNVTSNGTTSSGILLAQDKNSKSGKRVRFRKEPEIRYIERIPGNSCRKVNSKDAPVPVMATSVREEDQILSIILEWRPEWLEQQKLFQFSPQVSSRKPLRMLTNYNTFRDYYDVMTPLMLLELWRCVYRDWCYNNAPVKLACIETINSKHGGLYVNCYCLAERDSDNYFRNGDLLVAEFYLHDKNSKIATTKKFGHVVNVNKRRMNSADTVHTQLIGGPVPQFKIFVTIFIKKLQFKILEEKLMRVRLVSRIVPQLRIFKSVSNLYNSPLCNFILKPNIQQYRITKTSQMKTTIEDKLNNAQMMCIYEAYQICTRNEPGIYLIQGPPGTGKSYVIKNLIRQLLSDSTKNKNLPKCRILLCAPSNGAVDEIANNLLEMRSKMSKSERFKMIRLGPPTAIANARVKSISVQTLVENHLATQQSNIIKTNSFMSEEYNFLLKKKDTINNTILNMEASNVNYTLEVQKLRKVQESLERLKSNANSFQERKQAERDTENLIIEGAQIICSTLSSCIGSKLEELVAGNKIEFTCCIVDEATQSSEPESLIPLLLRINKLVLVGDPEQLPPTTLSQEAKELGHGNSLFSRIQNCLDHLPDNPIRMLTEQFRMHPEICKFPSKHFYGERLKTADVTASRIEKILDPCRLFCLNSNIDYKENEYLNKTEANLVLLLTDIVMKKTKYNIGIITPYTKQKDYLVSKYSTMRARETKEDEERYPPRVVINTVDGFQGQERDVIIISCVRYKSNIFLNDLQRLNVALTRAKHAVFICAHANLFKTESIWQKLEADAKSRSFFYSLTEKDSTDERYMSELILR